MGRRVMACRKDNGATSRGERAPSDRWVRAIVVVAAVEAVFLVYSSACTSTGPVEPKPALLAARLDSLRHQAFVTADTSKSQQVRAAYGVKLTILTEALFASAFGVKQREVKVNATFASGSWHALGYELVHAPMPTADSQYHFVLYRDDFSTALDLIVEYIDGTPHFSYLFYALDSLYGAGAPELTVTPKSLGAASPCTVDSPFLDSLFTPPPAEHCQLGTFRAAASVKVTNVPGLAAFPTTYQTLSISTQTVNGVRFSP
jgi:hypothetical protein